MSDDAHDRWLALPGRERIALLDQALDHVRQARPCGEERCAYDCRPCLRATMDHVETLMAGHADCTPLGVSS